MAYSPDSLVSRSRIYLVDSPNPTWITSVERQSQHGIWDCPIGGRQEPGETPSVTAARELKEEVGVEGVKLEPFAQMDFQNGRVDHYFRGVTPMDPSLRSNEGWLRWLPVRGVLACRHDDMSRAILLRWARQQFSTVPPWTVTVKISHVFGGVTHINIVDTRRGLRLRV